MGARVRTFSHVCFDGNFSSLHMLIAYSFSLVTVAEGIGAPGLVGCLMEVLSCRGVCTSADLLSSLHSSMSLPPHQYHQTADHHYLFSYRLGLLGFASSPAIRDDNRAAGEEGVGNYGMSHCLDVNGRASDLPPSLCFCFLRVTLVHMTSIIGSCRSPRSTKSPRMGLSLYL